jgi:hypothetical protein
MDKSPFEKPGSSRLEEYRPLRFPPAEAGGKEEPARSRLKSKAVHPTTDGPGNTTQSPFHNGNHATDHAIARKQSDFTSIRNCATPERNLKMSKLQPGATPRDPRPQSFRGPTARIHTSLGQRPGTCAPNPFEGQRPASIPAWGNAPGLEFGHLQRLLTLAFFQPVFSRLFLAPCFSRWVEMAIVLYQPA